MKIIKRKNIDLLSMSKEDWLKIGQINQWIKNSQVVSDSDPNLNSDPDLNLPQNLQNEQSPSQNDISQNQEVKFGIVVIYPGRFQPFHLGHASVYEKIKENFAQADTYIATTNSTKDKNRSPFNFEDKKIMMEACGIPGNEIVQVKNPYTAIEIVQKYTLSNIKLIFAVSEKDMSGDNPRFSFGNKKDGSASYFQPFSDIDSCDPASNHGYILTVPTGNFTILDKEINSATEIRALYSQSSDYGELPLPKGSGFSGLNLSSCGCPSRQII